MSVAYESQHSETKQKSSEPVRNSTYIRVIMLQTGITSEGSGSDAQFISILE